MKELIFCCIFLSLVCACPVKAAAPCAVPPPIAFEGSTQAHWPATAKVHEKVLLRVDVPDLPQADGYANVRVEWLERP